MPSERSDAPTIPSWRSLLPVPVFLLIALTPELALAHGGTLRAAAQESLEIPAWLFLGTGGAVVGASFLLASLMTDREFVRRAHLRHLRLELPPGAERWARRVGPLVGLAGLAVVLWGAFRGPEDPLANPAIMLVWVGWWAGFAMATYTLGNVWPLINPWRAIAARLPVGPWYEYPPELGAWAATVGLLGLVWVEVVSPLADDPAALGWTVLAYTAATLVGATVFGTEDWFERVDPVSRVFRAYGRVAPGSVGSPAARGGADDSGPSTLRITWPGARLAHHEHAAGRGDVAFVVALLWGTTYDGLVGTPAWAGLVRDIVGAGVPPLAAYLVPLVGGFGLFYGAYLSAATIARRAAETYLAEDLLAARFAPPLLAIAAGYHLAHFLAYLVSLAPPLAAALLAPLGLAGGPAAPIALPGWFGGVAMAAVLGGHLVAIWVAHATAYALFPSRLQAVRSQYGFVAVMVIYTMLSLWIVSRPAVAPPFVGG